ncbi:MAG TPA: APC family permease, partial [Ruminococcaceae bacterium]|nr:APC family permease [Oscillospiraceae bacterium]
ALSVINITALTAVTLISNIGTFLLYGMTNLIALVAQARRPKRNPLTAVVVPVLGMLANAGMLVAVVVMGILSGGSTKVSAVLAIGASLAWLAVGTVYFRVHSRKAGKDILVDKNAASAQ